MADYKDWWDEFRARSNQQEQHMKFFSENKSKLGLEKVQTLISVGAGCGEVDIHTIKECMPNIQHYTALEPNKLNRDTLEANLQRDCPKLKCKVLDAEMPGWEGPGEMVDMVFAIHVGWYFKEPSEVYKEMMRWLKPGGKLIIGHALDDFIFSRLVEKLCNTSREFWYEELKAELVKADLNEYEEYFVPMQFKTEGIDERMLTHIINKLGVHEGENMVKCMEKAVDLCKQSKGMATSTNAFVCITKD